MAGLLTVLFPRVRVAVLENLFRQPDVAVHLRELVRRSGLGLGTMQGELRGLEAAGLVTSRADGNRKLFQANKQHPAFPEMHSLVVKMSGRHEVLAEALEDVSGIEAAFIFGSVAQGTEGADSDIDLMVIGAVGLRTLAPALRKASETLGREINPHVFTPAEWKKRRAAGDAFVADILRHPRIFLKGADDELE
jgi:predicted nucleotidyltransferase